MTGAETLAILKGVIMKRAFLFVLVLLSVTCFASGKVHWGYEGHEGPSNWGSLSEDFYLCESGVSQSPVNIETGKAVTVSMEQVKFSYRKSDINLLNNGHALQANYDSGSYITVKGKRFDLLQFHFHSPSENTVNGSYFGMEAHLVHKSAGGELAVVGVLLKKGKENEFMKKFWSKMPDDAGKTVNVKGGFNVSEFLPGNKSYYH